MSDWHCAAGNGRGTTRLTIRGLRSTGALLAVGGAFSIVIAAIAAHDKVPAASVGVGILGLGLMACGALCFVVVGRR